MWERWSRPLSAPAHDERLAYVGDAVVAVVLAVSAVVAPLTGDPAFGASTTGGVVLALCATLPVALRRRWPITVTAVLLVGNGLCLAAAAPHEGALQPFVALVLAGYSVGALAEGRYAVVAPAVLAVLAIPVFALGLADHQSLGNEMASYVWLASAWVVGRVVRQMRNKSRELERANAALAEHREQALAAAAALERGRIAREIHDVVAHNVSMMVVQAAAAARVLRADEPEVRQALETIADTGRQTVDEMRSLLGVLRSDEGERAELAPQPGLADVELLVEGLERAGVTIGWRVEGEPRLLPQALDLSAYRIVQEALTNAMKHAPGAGVEVYVRYGKSALELDIVDTGGARKDASTTGGHGLVGMRERAAMFGGGVTTSASADGFRVTATLPMPEGAAV